MFLPSLTLSSSRLQTLQHLQPKCLLPTESSAPTAPLLWTQTICPSLLHSLFLSFPCSAQLDLFSLEDHGYLMLAKYHFPSWFQQPWHRGIMQ